MFRSRSLMQVKVCALLAIVALSSFNCNWYKNWRAKKNAKKSSAVKIVPNDPHILPSAGSLGGLGSDSSIPWGSVAGGATGAGLGSDSLGIDQNEPPRVAPAGLLANLDIIYFDYDSFTLKPEMQQLLDRNIEWLRQNQQIVIQIEGHCDERGTFEYNMNLGQKRADTVREYLAQRGIDPNRLYTISYGEERPLEFGTDESTFSRNRRVQFLAYGE